MFSPARARIVATVVTVFEPKHQRPRFLQPLNGNVAMRRAGDAVCVQGAFAADAQEDWGVASCFPKRVVYEERLLPGVGIGGVKVVLRLHHVASVCGRTRREDGDKAQRDHVIRHPMRLRLTSTRLDPIFRRK